MSQLLAALMPSKPCITIARDSPRHQDYNVIKVAGPQEEWDLPKPKTLQEAESVIFWIEPNGTVSRLEIIDKSAPIITRRSVRKLIGSITEAEPIVLNKLASCFDGQIYYPVIVWANDARNKTLYNDRANDIACRYATCSNNCGDNCECYEDYIPHGCIITYFME